MNSQTIAGNSPLHIACLNGQGGVIEELVTYKADVNALNDKKQVDELF